MGIEGGYEESSALSTFASLSRSFRQNVLWRKADKSIVTATTRQVEALKRAYANHTFVSLGNHCYTGRMLKDWGLKRSSMPFDWIFSNSAMISHCIDDDFKTFLERSYHSRIAAHLRAGKNVNKCDHLFYRENFGLLNVFNHWDPTIDVDYHYYRRCVHRFRSHCSSDDPTVFISTFWDLDNARDDFLHLEHVLRRRMVGPFVLLGVAVRGPSGSPAVLRTIFSSQTHILLEMNSQSRMLDQAFEIIDDDIVLRNGISAALVRRHQTNRSATSPSE